MSIFELPLHCMALWTILLIFFSAHKPFLCTVSSFPNVAVLEHTIKVLDQAKGFPDGNKRQFGDRQSGWQQEGGGLWRDKLPPSIFFPFWSES